LREAGFEVGRAAVPAGEESKSLNYALYLYDQAIEHGLDRNSLIVALGGGVVGDLAGYVAATYLRGIRYVQVPTSVVALVDSAVGGKTGVNLKQGKNLIGCFHQPSLVVADIDTLSTLPDREYRSGMAEVVKYGVIWDADFFELLEANCKELLKGPSALMEDVVARCCSIKAEVVRRDEREGGLRAILNFGHTVGHAIEKVAGYGEYLHGEAISVGMNYAAYLSVAMKGMTQADGVHIVSLLKDMGLPTKAPGCEWGALREAIG
ncbi:unnamed protein product, partial [marine sediment metagenome]